MICPHCKAEDGYYGEVEDFNACCEPEWSYYTFWHCMECDKQTYDYQEGFYYGDDEF